MSEQDVFKLSKSLMAFFPSLVLPPAFRELREISMHERDFPKNGFKYSVVQEADHGQKIDDKNIVWTEYRVKNIEDQNIEKVSANR